MTQRYTPFTITRVLFYILAFLSPLVITSINFELFEFNKMLLVYLFTVLIGVSIVIDFVLHRKMLIPTTPLDIPIFLFLLSQLISTFISIDPHISLFGYYGRFNGGLLSTICYIILYYSAIISFHESISSIVEKVTFGVKNFFSAFRFGKNIDDHLPLPTTIGFNTASLIYLGYAVLASAIFVSIYAVLQKFGIDAHLWVQDVQNRVFSTLGQPNWLAAYIIVVSFITVGNIDNVFPRVISRVGTALSSSLLIIVTLYSLIPDSYCAFIQGLAGNSLCWVGAIYNWLIFATILGIVLHISKLSDRFPSAFPISLSSLFYISLLFTKSRSGFLAFWICNIVFLLIVFIKNNIINTKKSLLLFPFYAKYERTSGLNNIIILNILYVLFTFVLSSPISIPWINRNTAPIEQGNNGTALEDVSFNTTVTDSGDIRKIVWTGAWNAALARPYFGWGVETFAWVYYRFKPVEHNLTSEWDFLYNKAHNEYLNYAATSGFVGLGTYLLLITAFLWWYFKFALTKSLSPTYTLIISIGVGWISLLITNFFGFSVVVTSLFFWLLPAFSFLLAKSASISTYLLQLTPLKSKIAISIVSMFGLYLVFSIATYWLADYFYAKGIAAGEQDRYERSYEMLSNAVVLRPKEPAYLNELSETLSVLAYAYDEQKDATTAAELTEQSILATNKALNISPLNVSFWKGRTRVFYNLSQTNPIYLDRALQSIETAQALAPTDPKVAYNHAILLNNTGQKGKAIEILEQAIKMKPNYRDAAWALVLFYEEDKNIVKRDEWLRYILGNINPDDSEVKEKLGVNK